MLELWLGRSEGHGELAEDLGVRMQRVTSLAPPPIGNCRPARGHVPHVSNHQYRPVARYLRAIGHGARPQHEVRDSSDPFGSAHI